MVSQSDNVELGMWNVECEMKGILPCKIRLYSIDDTDSRQSPLLCKERWQGVALTERLSYTIVAKQPDITHYSLLI